MAEHWSKDAVNCRRCPRDGSRDGSRGCPLWWKTVQTEVETGRERIWEECGLVQLPVYLVEVIKASNRPAAAVESMRNEMALGIERVARALPRLVAGVEVQREALSPGSEPDS